MSGSKLDDKAILARKEIIRLLRIAVKETEKLKLQWEEISNILHSNKTA